VGVLLYGMHRCSVIVVVYLNMIGIEFFNRLKMLWMQGVFMFIGLGSRLTVL